MGRFEYTTKQIQYFRKVIRTKYGVIASKNKIRFCSWQSKVIQLSTRYHYPDSKEGKSWRKNTMVQALNQLNFGDMPPIRYNSEKGTLTRKLLRLDYQSCLLWGCKVIPRMHWWHRHCNWTLLVCFEVARCHKMLKLQLMWQCQDFQLQTTWYWQMRLKYARNLAYVWQHLKRGENYKRKIYRLYDYQHLSTSQLEQNTVQYWICKL